MNFLKFFTADQKENKSKARFKFPFFKDAELQNEIADNGFAVRPLLDTAQIEQLKKDFFKLLDMLPEPLPDTHWTSGRVNDTVVRNFARRAIEEVMPKALEMYFDPRTTDFIGGIFLAKKPSANSELTAHQDSSHTDETRYPAIYAWVPLTDTSVSNGAMHILPGSHLWGNLHRSLNVPWQFSGMEKKMEEHLKPIPMKAGEVLFFDSAAIHYSSNNMSGDIRPAINYFIKPQEALFLHHFIDAKTPEGKVEVFNVDIDFFYNCDFMQRPPMPPYQFLGYEDRVKIDPPI